MTDAVPHLLARPRAQRTITRSRLTRPRIVTVSQRREVQVYAASSPEAIVTAG